MFAGFLRNHRVAEMFDLLGEAVRTCLAASRVRDLGEGRAAQVVAEVLAVLRIRADDFDALELVDLGEQGLHQLLMLSRVASSVKSVEANTICAV